MSDASHVYRGFRLQALYILHRILSSTDEDIIFRPEGNEDLDILNPEGILIETVQVKSYKSLQLSDLGSTREQKPFFKRAASLLDAENHTCAKVVNFGSIGSELEAAWKHRSDLTHPDRKSVAEKLIEKHGLTEHEASLVLDSVELVSVEEENVHNAVTTLIKQTAAGIDATNAFDLFMQWIYQLSEKGAGTTKTEVIHKLNAVGKVLTDRANFLSEWHTSIKPIDGKESITTHSVESLRHEFFLGVSARYEHIETGLDFRRDQLISAIAEGFHNHDIVIVHGASGQGKSTLAYRYLHDHYPTAWRYEVRLIENPSHALRIASALSAQASALKAPIIVYVDVRPNDVYWSELIMELTQHQYIQVLVTVREEDFRRTNLPNYRFDHSAVPLQFDKSEARLIYDRAVESDTNVQSHFLNFETSWESFNKGGPLLEYVYLLTQTETLQERLREQLDNIFHEVQSHEATDKWDILRWVAVATAYEARVDYSELKKMVTRPAMIGQVVKELEEEYLIRRSANGLYIEGLHAIRSHILTTLMEQDDPTIWLETAKDLLPTLVESDLQHFVLNALVDRPAPEQTAFLAYLTSFRPRTWTGSAGVFRSLIWAGIRDYIESNRSLIDEVYGDSKAGWSLVLDIDLADLMSESFTTFINLATNERRQQIEKYRASQTPKSRAFEYLAQWLLSLDTAPIAPRTDSDWIGWAEIMGWGGQLGVAQGIDSWVTDKQLAELTLSHDLQLVGDVSFALYKRNPARHKTWVEMHQESIDVRLAKEYEILAIERDDKGSEDGVSRIRIHFIPTPINKDEAAAVSIYHKKDDHNQLHSATIERIKLIRFLYPTYERYASQGYGFGLGNTLIFPFDDTHKDIADDKIMPHWLIRVNQFAREIGEYPYRPKDWGEFFAYLMDIRAKIVSNLRDLQQGLRRHLERQKGVDIVKDFLNTAKWDEVINLSSQTPKLPQNAVDRWGFSSESSSSTLLSPTEQLGILGMNVNGSPHLRRPYISSSISLQQYSPYLQMQRDYLGAMCRFFNQGFLVTLTNWWGKQLPKGDPHLVRVQQKAAEFGWRENFDHLSTRNLWTAALNLHEFQYRFRELVGTQVSIEKLDSLEGEERDIVNTTWSYWYSFAYHPHQSSGGPGQKTREKWQLDNSIKEVLTKTNSTEGDSWKVKWLETDLPWNESPALWITIDMTDPIDYYRSVEVLIGNFRSVFGRRDPRALIDYLLERHYPHFVFLPTIRGKLLNSLCFAPYFASMLFEDKPLSESPLLFIPTELSSEQLEQLGMQIWTGEDFALANQLGNAFNTFRIVASQLAEFNKLPEASVTEAGFTRFQAYLNEQCALLSEHLQQYIDAGSELLNRANALSETERKQRPALIECVDILLEINDVVLPQGDGVWQLSLPELQEYTQKLEEIVVAGEALRLKWVSYIIDSQ